MAKNDLSANLPFGGFVPDGARALLDGWIDGERHFYPLLVQFEDTDAGGIVYHANYLSFAERGRSGWLRVIGVSQSDNLYHKQHGFVVRRATVDYQRPARLGDEIIVETALKELGRARLVASQIIRAAPQADKSTHKMVDGHIFAKVEVEIVMVNKTGRPIRFSPELVSAMTGQP